MKKPTRIHSHAENAITALAIFTISILIAVLVLAGLIPTAHGQTQITRCENGKGQVVEVTNHTCPPGFWRI